MLAAPLVIGLAFPAFAGALEQKLTATDGTSAQFGQSVAVDGDTAVVGAPRARKGVPGADEYSGAVYVFTRVGDRWVQTARLTASGAAAGDELGSSVAIDGDTIVAGAPTDRVDDSQGAVYTFARTGAAERTQTAKLTASDGVRGDYLGYSVAIDGQTIVAGAPQLRFGDPTGAHGAVYTFARTGAAARSETSKLTASDGGGLDELGWSVAIDGDTIVAGAPSASAVYTFATTGNRERSETARLTAAVGRALGGSVAIDGDTIVAGDGASSVYTFARTGASKRNQTAELTQADGTQEGGLDAGLGYSVAIGGDTIVAGAPLRTINLNEGAVYTFARTGAAARHETAMLTAPDAGEGDRFGFAVAIDGDTIIAGAIFDNVSYPAQGSAWIFYSPAPPPPAATCFGVRATIVPAAGQTTIQGTPGRDVIVGSDANDTINGHGGNDLICAGKGNDMVRGGSGDDRVRGDQGNDTVRGGTGDDKVGGDSGTDRLYGGPGNDLLYSTDDRTADQLDCGRGTDDARIDTRDQQRRCEHVSTT